jgi:Flp pilus assembly protein TadG
MKTCRLAGVLAAHARRFGADAEAAALIEFAMLLPLMLTLYLGGVEVSQAVSADRKVTLVSRTVADLVSQSASVSNADMSNILAAGTAVSAPYNGAVLKIIVSSVNIDASNKATILWSDTLNGTARTVGSTVTSSLPAALNVANTTLIWAEVSYAYKPVIGYVVTGTLTLHDQMFMRPRLSTSVQRTA